MFPPLGMPTKGQTVAKNVYRAKQGIALSIKGQRYHFSGGELILEDHPVNPADHPDFEEISEYVERTSQPRRRGVLIEQATADPGEKRRLGGLLGPKSKSDSESDSDRPPTSGKGSGVEAWREYATKVTDSPAESWAALSRDEIIELLDSEGVESGDATNAESGDAAAKD